MASGMEWQLANSDISFGFCRMSGQSGGQRMRLSMLNEHLICKLCGGYFIDATTIIECLHSFCKSCIVKYLENNKFCPVCEIQVHKNKPLLNIRPDQTLQDIVYKLVPGCYQNEMRHRQEFYTKHPSEKDSLVSPQAHGEPVDSYIYSADESLSLSLEYYSPESVNETETDKEATLKHLPRRYLRCPAAVTIFHLQKLIRAKYGLSEAHRVDIMYKEILLCASYTLMDVMYIYHWKRKVPLHLSYRIFESSPKRLKLSEDNDEFKQSLSNNSMELESNDDEQSVKREWKEVQLKISETGVMSVTDISSLDTKKSTNVNEINQQSSLDQADSNVYNVNKTVVKVEEKESLKSCTEETNSKQIEQDKSTKISEQAPDVKVSPVLSSAIPTSENISMGEEIKLKSIDQRDLSNELMKTDSDKCENTCLKVSSDSTKTSSSDVKNQEQSLQQTQKKIKTESTVTLEKQSKTKQNVTNNNVVNKEAKADTNTKQNTKLSEVKTVPSAGSKINALSAKLQFQPKVGQVNNTYSKKAVGVDKKIIPPSPTKSIDAKTVKAYPKLETKHNLNISSALSASQSKVSPLCSNANSVVGPSSQANAIPTSSTTATYVTAPSGIVDSCVPSINLQQRSNPLSAPSTESLASIGLHVSTTMPSQVNLNNWLNDRGPATLKSSKAASSDQQLRSVPGMPQIGKDIVCSTTATSSPTSSMSGRFSIQTPSMSIYSITTSMKCNVYTTSAHSYTTASTKHQSSPKPNFDLTTSLYPVGAPAVIPPCPDAIPISLMKASAARKSTTMAGAGSKINDICAKIGESSKEKSKIEAQRGKPELPDLLKISKKGPTPSSGEGASATSPLKHIPNIPNVPIYTPSSPQAAQAPGGSEPKEAVKRLAIATSQPSIATTMPPMQKMPAQKKHSQSVGYKTLRDPPKPWNPTMPKNNYVAAKNQAKEMQNQAQAGYGVNDEGGGPKLIPSKPAKIFKNRNMPRYLGNPASGVKPMYGVGNDQTKEKDQSVSVSKSGSTMSMMKIDPQTLSPIVSSSNSPIVSPPPYSPTTRTAYQNSPFTPDLCRNSSNSPLTAARNSPVNILSTNPFIPSHTRNTDPRLIYSHFPPAFADPSRFSNPLIRSPIGIPPSSAFHSSLPPSINKLYQRSEYMTQPQTSVAGFAPGVAVVSQPATVQRIPPSGHAPSGAVAASSASSPSSSSKSPKTASSSALPSSAGAGSSSVTHVRSNSLTMASSASSSTSSSAAIVDSAALHSLVKGLAAQQRDLNAFDLTKAEGTKLSSDGSGSNKSSEAHAKSKVSPSAQDKQRPSGEASARQNAGKASNSGRSGDSVTAKELDGKEKSLAKVNGGITITIANKESSKPGTMQQQAKADKVNENKSSTITVDNRTSSTKPESCRNTTPVSKADGKTAALVEVKQDVEAADTEKMEKKIVVEVQKAKAEA